jgi:hypothetical protein
MDNGKIARPPPFFPLPNDSQMTSEEQGQLQSSTPIPSLFAIFDNSHVIPNTVSMARDQFASERNFLTFLRFSATLIVLGKGNPSILFMH